MKLIKLFQLSLAALISSQVAMADFDCKASESVTLKAFTLESTSGIFSHKAIVVVKNQGLNELYTGKVNISPTRVGSYNDYTVVNEQGSELKFRISDFFTFVPLNCTRAGCESTKQIHKVGGQLSFEGKDYVLSCTELQ